MFLNRQKKNQKNTGVSRDLLLAVQEYVRRNYQEADEDSGADGSAASRMQKPMIFSDAAMQVSEPDEEALLLEPDEAALPAPEMDNGAGRVQENVYHSAFPGRAAKSEQPGIPKKYAKPKMSEIPKKCAQPKMPEVPKKCAQPGTTMFDAAGMPYDQAPLQTLTQNSIQPSVQASAQPPVQAMMQSPAQPSIQSPDQKAQISSRKLDDLLRQMDETFSQMLLRLIDERGLKDSDVYHKANIDRRLFSKIRNDVNYTPTKKTVLAFVVALELSMDETRDLLLKAGYALSNSSRFDVIVSFFFETRRYDLFEINEVLMDYGEPLLCD